MNPRRIWAVARKEFIHVFRDWRSLGMAIGIPVLLLTLFGYALTLDVDRVPLIVWDQSQTTTSRAFLEGFRASRYYSFRGSVDRYSAIEHSIDNGDAVLALIIPRDFAAQLDSGRSTAVQLIADGSDSNTATIAIGYAEMITHAYNQQILLEHLQRAGAQLPHAPLDVRARVWFNEDLESKNFIVPGLIAVIMSMIAAVLTSLTIAREWERGTMEQLISTPVKAPELIFGKMIPYFIIGMADMLLAMAMGAFLFHVPFRGSLTLLFGMAGIFLLGSLAQGMLISIVTKNQLIAGQLAIISTFLPAFLLSGFAFSISNMPTALQYLTYAVSARYFVTLIKAIYMKGAGLESLWIEAALLMVFCVILLSLAVLKFKKKLT
ncbi:MAG TPA: ABC transporter permease [Candidatus Hydrogenedentes bacterium]|nr:ABC transporter permease [Candidatus Hydrogenedentota bacterium]